jgi:hypothetical protein
MAAAVTGARVTRVAMTVVGDLERRGRQLGLEASADGCNSIPRQGCPSIAGVTALLARLV